MLDLRRGLSALGAAAIASACGPPPSRLGVSPDVTERTKGPLSSEESTVLAKRGFVITEKTAPSFHVGYTSLFREHQPVFVSADAVLEAWHASYGSIFAELEATALEPALASLLDDLRKNLKLQKGRDQARKDVDLFLGVAASLAVGAVQPGVAGAAKSDIDLIARRVHAADGEGSIELFGQKLDFDFAAIAPRGHYKSTPALQHYFRTLTFLRRTPLQIATETAGKWMVDRRVLEATELLRALLHGEALRKWQELDGIMTARAGVSSSLSLRGFDAAMNKLGGPIAKAKDAALAAAFMPAPPALPALSEPRERTVTFLVFGPRSYFDSVVLQAVSSDALSVKRPMPMPLDVAATVLGNKEARKLLAPQVEEYGREYETVLTTMRDKADKAGAELWSGSLHHRWLHALRTLSPDAERDRALPPPLTTEGWSRRLLNTQLASWTHLRHDQIPLAKPAERGVSICEYPAGYIDPYPAFFSAMEDLSRGARVAFESIPLQTPVKAKSMAYFDRFAGTMGTLRGMAEKERANFPFSKIDLEYLNHMVSIDGKTAGCSLELEPGGWFGDLYYDHSEAIWGSPTITDVFTQQTDTGGNASGRVLHLATGDPRMIAVTIRHDGGQHTQTYRGFVAAYSERVTENFVRFDDAAWSLHLLRSGNDPAPSWLRPLMPEHSPL